MRKKADWGDLVFQFVSFALVCLALSLLTWPFLVKLVAAFGFSMLLAGVYKYVRRTVRRRRQQPKRLRVMHIENVED
ncbi:hypothetical protein IV498_01245 [Paenarthrobacter sp. Z7-10]|uniref:hypothetical protein n=1 Tax=Paenarthrobacter sp. Z7-10 TaxID=2787635 RepID=UPI0022A92FB6|nr:hypothetical protein [Paenarthrobacter sp. Z7-10]MCZ2401841.1 hypothetical protein [Paenarthrobacter sp. Z7-10]